MGVRKLTEKNLWRIFRGQLTIREAGNYGYQQNAGFIQTMMPIIERVYDNDKDKREVYERRMEYFLTNGITNAIPVGITAVMEEMYANNPDMNPNVISTMRTTFMGPLAGPGDSLLNGAARPILASLAISLIHTNLGRVGPIFFVVGISIISLGIRYLEVFQGYKQEIEPAEKINSSSLISKITDIIIITAYTIVGGFTPVLVVTNISIEVKSGEVVINTQKTLDGPVSGALGPAYTFLIYYLVTEKKGLAVRLTFFMAVFAILAVCVGILG